VKTHFLIRSLIILLLITSSITVIAQTSGRNPNADQGNDDTDKPSAIDSYPAPRSDGAARYSLVERWDKNDLTYFIHNCPSTVACDVAHQAIHQAFDMWDDISAINFSEVSNVSDADIELRWTLNDPDFGTRGDTLAFAYFPDYGGDIYFDDAERWTVFDGGDTDLFVVAAHEIGHAIGIDHSDDTNSIMFPYSGGVSVLGSDDIEAIHRLYGPANDGDSDTTVVTADTPDDLPSTTDGTSNAIETVNGYLDDNIFYQLWTIDAEAGETITFTMEATGGGNLDTFISLMDVDLNEVFAENDDKVDSTNSELVYTFEESGEYTIVATRFDWDEGLTYGNYTLKAIRDSLPDAPNTPDLPSVLTNLTLQNNSGSVLCFVWFSPSTSDSWGLDQLPSDGVIANGDVYSWTVEPDEYDVMVSDCDDNRLDLFFVDLTHDTTLNVTSTEILISENTALVPIDDTTTLTIQNNAGYTICFVQFSPSTSDSWGDDQLPSDGVLSDGSSYSWDVYINEYDVRVLDCDQNPIERFGIDLFSDTILYVTSTEILLSDENTALVPTNDTNTLTVQNNAGYTICFVQFSPSISDSWGDDQLPSDGVIVDGSSYSWDVDADVYDIRVLDCDQNPIERFGIDLSRDVTLNATATELVIDGETPSSSNVPSDNTNNRITTLAIENISGEVICYVYFSPTTSDSWGGDQLPSDGVLSDGETYTWEITPDTYDLRLRDCDQNDRDEYRINMTESLTIIVTETDILFGP